MSLLRRASSPIRNFGKEKNALIFDVIFQHLSLDDDYQDKFNRHKCWAKWIRTSKEGQTKKKVTVSNGLADFMMEKIPIQCTCHYTDETGYEPKMLTLEVYMRSVKDKTSMVGSCEINLTSYAMDDQNSDLTFQIKDEDGKSIGGLQLSINVSFVEGKGKQPRGARLNSPRRTPENGHDQSNRSRSLNASPSPSPGFSQEPSGTPRSSAAKGAHRRQADDDSEPKSTSESAFPKSPQTASGKLVARIYFSDGTYTATVVRPNQTAAFVAQQVRNRRAAGGMHTLPDGEVLEEMRLFEGAVEGRMIRQLQDDELVAKVIAQWPEEEDAFLIFMMPTVNVEIGTEITSLDDLEEETEMTETFAPDEDDEEDLPDEHDHISDVEEEDEEGEEEDYGYGDLPVIDGKHPHHHDEDDEEEMTDGDEEDQIEEDESDEESDDHKEEEAAAAMAAAAAAAASDAKAKQAIDEKAAAEKKAADLELRLKEATEAMERQKAEMNAALGTELKDQNPKPSQQTKGACGGCVLM